MSNLADFRRACLAAASWQGAGQRFAAILILAAIALTMPGCGHQFDPEQYGEVIHEVPTIHTDGRPYPLPQLEDSDDAAAKTGE